MFFQNWWRSQHSCRNYWPLSDLCLEEGRRAANHLAQLFGSPLHCLLFLQDFHVAVDECCRSDDLSWPDKIGSWCLPEWKGSSRDSSGTRSSWGLFRLVYEHNTMIWALSSLLRLFSTQQQVRSCNVKICKGCLSASEIDRIFTHSNRLWTM